MLDFAANFTTRVFSGVDNGRFILKLFRVNANNNDVLIARSYDIKGLPETGEFDTIDITYQSSLIYKGRLGADATYRFCLDISEDLDAANNAPRRNFLWGYRIWGSGYNFSQTNTIEPTL